MRQIILEAAAAPNLIIGCICFLFHSPMANAVITYLMSEGLLLGVAGLNLRIVRKGHPQLPKWMTRRFVIIWLVVGSAGALVQLAASIYFLKSPRTHTSMLSHN